MASKQRGVRNRGDLGGGGGGGGTIPTPIPNNTDLPIWGDNFVASAHYASFADRFEIFTLPDGPTSPGILIKPGNDASGPLELISGSGGGAARPPVAIGDQLTSFNVGQKEVMPTVLPRSSGMRFDGVDLSPNRQVLSTQHQVRPAVNPAALIYPDDPNWLIMETPGSGGFPSASYGGVGLFIATAGNAGDGVVISPRTGIFTAWEGFLANRGLELLIKQEIHTYTTIVAYRAEAGFKASPVLDYGFDSGNGSAAAFFRYDDTGGIPATWAYVTDAGGAGVVADSGIPVAPDTTYVLAIWFDPGSDDVFFFIDDVLVGVGNMAGAAALIGRPYVGCSSPGSAVLKGIHVPGQAVSRNNV